ncbi:hypothetical protein [Panacibacter ginsenosidivorans]|uniref:hypothetical protein n=1 Tax=Panacibacter ginsenosidivorans TaxID=1813871 RepID=UPI0013150549|nr:hypothetical protein [Panacibacter ginsenosidivorans]
MLQLQNISFNKQRIDRTESLPILTGKRYAHNDGFEFSIELHTHKRPGRYKDLC